MKMVKFHITVKGIVVFQSKILLMKRARPSSDGLGYWELPGGGLEYGETPNEALLREIKEETGLAIQILKPVYTFTKIREDYQTIGIGYVCTSYQGEVILSNEHTEYRFCSLFEAKELLSKEIFDDITVALQEYDKI